MNLLIEPYLSRDGVIAMAAATFALGLILGALIMDWAHEKERIRKTRPAAVRPVAPVVVAGRHRATPEPPPRGQGGVSGGGGHPVPVGRIDVRA